MKAQLIKENINPIFKPKSEEEIENALNIVYDGIDYMLKLYFEELYNIKDEFYDKIILKFFL